MKEIELDLWEVEILWTDEDGNDYDTDNVSFLAESPKDALIAAEEWMKHELKDRIKETKKASKKNSPDDPFEYEAQPSVESLERLDTIVYHKV